MTTFVIVWAGGGGALTVLVFVTVWYTGTGTCWVIADVMIAVDTLETVLVTAGSATVVVWVRVW